MDEEKGRSLASWQRLPGEPDAQVRSSGNKNIILAIAIVLCLLVACSVALVLDPWQVSASSKIGIFVMMAILFLVLACLLAGEVRSSGNNSIIAIVVTFCLLVACSVILVLDPWQVSASKKISIFVMMAILLLVSACLLDVEVMSEFPAVFQWNRLAMCFGVRAEDRADGIAENQDVAEEQFQIQKRLEAAGAKTGKIQISLAWDSIDDLDLHVQPPEGKKIFYGNKQSCGGRLDVDCNAPGSDLTNTPVENVFFDKPKSGQYSVDVVCCSKRVEGAVRWTLAVTQGSEKVTRSGYLSKANEVAQAYTFVY